MNLTLRLGAIVLGSLLALILIAWALNFRGWFLVLVELGLLGVMLGATRTLEPRIERLLQGARGERAVGDALEVLAPHGWHALHNVSFGRGDVDHVLVGPGGLFTIETKSHRRPIRIDRIDRRMLRQSYAEKRLLERVTGYKFRPLLVFSNAWLVGDVPAIRDGVTILPVRMLVRYISHQKPVVKPERAREVYEHLRDALVDGTHQGQRSASGSPSEAVLSSR